MSIQSLLPSTVEMIMSGLDSDEWRTAEEVAAIIHRDAQTTRARLRALRAAGKAVECQVFQLDNGGDGLKWRKLPPGAVGPIYERRPGWDDRALTEAMNQRMIPACAGHGDGRPRARAQGLPADQRVCRGRSDHHAHST